MSDKVELRALAKFVSERVDLRVADGGVARITLNLADESGGVEGEGVGSMDGNGHGGGSPGGGKLNGARSSFSSRNAAVAGREDGGGVSATDAPKQYVLCSMCFLPSFSCL